MTMTPDEERRLAHLERNVERLLSRCDSMFNVIVGPRDAEGHAISGQPGLAERVTSLANRVGHVEDKVEEIDSKINIVKKNWKLIVLAAAIGFLLCALAVGIVTWMQAGDAVKEGIKLVK